jgi:heptosyltransferase III
MEQTSSKKTAAVIPAKGIGDALLMMIASHQLLKEGFRVTTFHPALKDLQDWFKDHVFEEAPPLEEVPFLLDSFDLIVAENDNSPKITALFELAQNRATNNLSIFYPTYSASKHFPLSSLDQVFDPHKPMADNIAQATAALLNRELSKENGLTIPSGLIHRLYKKRIIIHPASSSQKKNWSPRKYVAVARQLKKRGLQPVFTVSAAEREEWEHLIDLGFQVPEFKTLNQLAGYVYESGFMIGNDSLVGHLASNLSIPTLIISDDRQRMLLWQPGWFPSKVITPAPWVPNFKFLRLREQRWQSFITIGNVLAGFDNLFRSF